MKKVILSTVALLAIGVASAQSVKFGAKLGLNVANQSYSNDYIGVTSPSTDPMIGFHIGGLAEIKLTDKFAIQPELLFSMQGSKQTTSEFDTDGYSYTSEDKINFTYINVPVMFKYFVIKKLSIEAGPQVGFLVSAKDKYESTETFEGTVTKESKTVDVKNLHKSIDFGFNIGAGYDITDNFFTSLRYNIGLSDIGQGGTVNIDGVNEVYPKFYKVKNNVLQLSIGYKF